VPTRRLKRVSLTTSGKCTSGRREIEIAFLDLFSRQAPAYAAARPTYPDALYEFIVSLAPRLRLAWDCGTGNGQAARDLARYFEHVVATDASADQIAHAPPRPNVEYHVAAVDVSGLAPHSVDLVAVAQALHWFAHEAFFAEVRRVTVPAGVIAAWSYGWCHAGSDIDPLLRAFEKDTLGPYWHPGRRWVDEGYRTIPFPFKEIKAPAFQLRAQWTLRQLDTYLRSWSAVDSFRRERGEDPVSPLIRRIATNWGREDQTREITWPLNIRVGRVG
jgi:SAM-dependent methyltransferase